jgi:hypothetical protein
MRQSSKRALQFAVAGGCTALVMGCESFPMDVSSSTVQAADDPGLTVSRARVVAELKEAQRLGLITVGEETPRNLTAEEMRLIAQAGDAAVVAEVSAPKTK